jgi:hypothetical protein
MHIVSIRGLNWPKITYEMTPSPLSGQEMPFFKVIFVPALNDFIVPAVVSKKQGSESQYKLRSQFDSC